MKSVPDIEQLRTIQHFDSNKVILVKRDANENMAVFERIEDGTYGGVDDGDYEVAGNDGRTFWRKKMT